METYIKVYATAQNRTALGIIHSYLKIHPDCTLAELKAAFPDSLNPDSGVKVNFKTLAEVLKQMEEMDWKGYFTDEDCLLKLKDGSQVAVVSMWTAKSLERLVEKAKEYGIVVAEAESVDKALCKNNGFYLEYLTPFKLERMDFARWPDTKLFNEIRKQLTAGTVDFYFEFIHFVFRKENGAQAVYADGAKVYCAEGDDCTKVMALGVLKGYVEQMNELLFNVKPSVAPGADKADVVKFIEAYVEKMAPYMIARDLNKRVREIMELQRQETLLEDCADCFRGSLTCYSGSYLQGLGSRMKCLNLPAALTSEIEKSLNYIQMIRASHPGFEQDDKAVQKYIEAHKEMHKLDVQYL